MCTLIKSNLGLLGIEEAESTVIEAEAHAYLQRVIAPTRGATAARNRAAPWDIVYFDPPYAIDYLPVLERLGTQVSELLSETSIVIVEHLKKKDLPEQLAGLSRYRVLKQGDSALSFYEVNNAIPERHSPRH